MTSRWGRRIVQPLARVATVTVAALSLACASVTPAVRQPAVEDPMVHAMTGAMEEQDRRLGAALREYTAAAHADDDPYLWYKVGTLSLRVGDVERAAAALARAADSPGAPLPWLRQAAAVQSLSGRPLEALKIHLRVLGARPGDPGSALAAAKILVGMGMPDSAVVIMATMGTPGPGDHAHATERARLFLAAGRPDLAVILCDSIDADQNPEARLICSSALAADGRVDDAVGAYLTTAAAAECHERTLDECYESLLRLARPDAASEVADRAMNCPGAHGAWATRRAYALVAAGRLDEAEPVLEDRWRREPNDVAALDLLSSLAYRRGRHGRAESLLRRGVEAFPEAPSLRRRLAGLYRDRGQIADAMRILADEAGAGPDTTAAALLMAGWTGAGFPDRAVAQAVAAPLSGGDAAFQAAAAWERLACVRRSASAFEEILRRDPQHGQSCNYLGYMLAVRGFQLARAETLVQCALRVEPDNPYYLDSLGWVYYRQGRLSDSVQLLRRALALDPAESEVMKHLGIALIHSGASEEGMTLLRRAADDRPWDMELRAVLKDAIP